jgi:purine catabolism regulator
MQLDSAERQRELIARLSDHHLAGLGFGTGFKHEGVPAPLLAAAAERDFPVFEVPYEVPFLAITEAAFSRLVNEQYAVLRRALAAHEKLERIVLSEQGLGPLAGALAALLGAAVIVLDSRGEPLAQHAFRRQIDPDTIASAQAEVQARGRRREARAFVPAPADGDQGLALPVASDGGPADGSLPDGAGAARVPEAWLVAIKDAGPLSDFDRLTLHQAVTIVALELLRARVAGDTERRLAGDVLAAVVRGELAGPDLARRLTPFGLGERVAAIVVKRSDDGRSPDGALEDAISSALRDEAASGLVASDDGLACVLVPGLPDEELIGLAERVAERVDAALRGAVRAGVGRAVAGGDARRSFHEARCALEAVSMAGEAGSASRGREVAADRDGRAGARVATYKDLGSFQLLLSLQDDEALRLFCDSILGPIEASEGHYGGELMRSLEAFIEENGQWERAARRLYCHRHTLRYRIRRVEELTGRDLSTARDRIDFWLALRGRELVA